MLITSSFSFPVLADEELPDVNYSLDKGQNNRSYDELYNEFLDYGYTPADADYHAKFDILVTKLEEEEIQVDLDNEEELSDSYVRSHPREFKTRVLGKDKKALKKAVSSNQALFNGAVDIEKAKKRVNKIRDEHGAEIGSQIRIDYPDGSTARFLGTVEKEDSTEEEVQTHTIIAGPWDQSVKMSSSGAEAVDNAIYAARTYFDYSSAAGTARVNDTYRFRLKFNGYPNDASKWSSHYETDAGATSSSGVVSIDIENLSNRVGTKATGRYQYLQGYTDARFKVSKAFSAQAYGLSISVEANKTWRQYAITEVQGYGTVHHWAGQFR